MFLVQPVNKLPLWLSQFYNWAYYHPADHSAAPRVLDRQLMSPLLRRFLPDDELYAFPREVRDE
jgi:hypothetical protein